MKQFSRKLIIIRGNSGSGKSTIANKIRVACHDVRKIAIIEQDYLRRIVLKEKEIDNGDNIDLIFQTVTFALSRNYDVVLEGILYFSRYGKMLSDLIRLCPDYYVYYLDVSFQETLQRHQTKPNCNEFGEKEMRSWYKSLDLTNFPTETIIPETSSLQDSVDQIIKQSGLL